MIGLYAYNTSLSLIFVKYSALTRRALAVNMRASTGLHKRKEQKNFKKKNRWTDNM